MTSRRASARVPLRSTVHLTLSPDEVIDLETKEISSSSFACVSPQPLPSGSTLNCALRIPANKLNDNLSELILRCHVEVVKVEKADDGSGYLVDCKILDYHVEPDVDESPGAFTPKD